jgi:hypothetical protein
MFRFEEPEPAPKLQFEEHRLQFEGQQLAEAQLQGWDCSLVGDLVDLSGDHP